MRDNTKGLRKEIAQLQVRVSKERDRFKAKNLQFQLDEKRAKLNRSAYMDRF